MAYLITNLGKKEKGTIISVSANKKKYSLKLINKCEFSKSPINTIKVDNYNTNLIIPETGYWKLKSFNDSQLSDYFFDFNLSVS